MGTCEREAAEPVGASRAGEGQATASVPMRGCREVGGGVAARSAFTRLNRRPCAPLSTPLLCAPPPASRFVRAALPHALRCPGADQRSCGGGGGGSSAGAGRGQRSRNSRRPAVRRKAGAPATAAALRSRLASRRPSRAPGAKSGICSIAPAGGRPAPCSPIQILRWRASLPVRPSRMNILLPCLSIL